ncbi:hypothetical protein DACRYDRAFT_95011 [Dacryopinax primogenitus]|uniref:GPI-anchored wall transfer protein n=1 Tax=Dacryopinax primogenitus (strain DJM 731) TaxID=1858805 RepID=M5FXV3_DACPD|nr:uncharacterized protein DACRYDRAFT_95011 [Dacryopinax primogenitus]EJU01339.1 hypothetical protein DACRYDRAFT_95011 [Dacryopinax primogenitus]
MSSTSSTSMLSRPSWRFLHEFAVLVLPLLVGITLGAKWGWALNLGLWGRAGAVYWNERRSFALHPHPPPQPTPSPTPKYHYPPLTTYRAQLLLLTVLSILAVDFPVFPREQGKTSSLGWSLMDVGVGSFVLSSGIAASRLSPSTLGKTLRRQLPLLLLALARVVAVKALNYPEQLEEYGYHWNFFCTLFLLPLLSLPFRPFLRYAATHASKELTAGVAVALALGVSGAHQFWLDSEGQEWVMGPDREGLLAQNKEGVSSLPGYLAIYLLGQATGLLLPLSLPPFGEPPASEVLDRLVPLLSVLAAVFLGTRYHALGDGACRRTANMQYVLHTGVYNVLFLCAYILLDAYYFPASQNPPSGISPSSTSNPPPSAPPSTSPTGPSFPPPSPRTPPLFLPLSQHPLPLFLLSNLLTGLINLLLPTMYVRHWAAMLVLGTYAAAVCGVGWVWKGLGLGW